MKDKKKIFLLWSGIVLSGIMLLLYQQLYRPRQYLLLSILMVLLTMLPFFIRFELKRVQAREIVPLAVLIAAAAVSRIPFSVLPSVQPTTFVIIVSAIVFGAEAGFMVGSLAALVSNMFLGQGPWTVWQMFSWGLIGLIAGLLRKTWVMRTIGGRIGYGIAAAFIFGWLMNISAIFSFMGGFSWEAFLAHYAASVYFDSMHAVSNVVFISLFSAQWMRVLRRYKLKYKLYEDKWHS